ncbi:MAG TPA: hypothetical protein VHL58_10700 [Thermoanaerobaculia bacterium]|nr:hypothetical protein [Thermoanaerobaculia bacterium]
MGLYEMATGRRPFSGSSGVGLMAAILSSEPPPIRTLQPALPAALEKNPDERWQTAHDVARQLRWLSDGLSAEQVQAHVRQSKAGISR